MALEADDVEAHMRVFFCCKCILLIIYIIYAKGMSDPYPPKLSEMVGRLSAEHHMYVLH